MEPAIDGTFEMIMYRNPALEGDLFKLHASKPGLWRFHGRADDIIVLSNEEKFNPVPRNGHPQASLILEPWDYSYDPGALIEELWVTVEKANAEAPGHARIIRDLILVGSKDMAFDRLPKGTIIRSSTAKRYGEQITELYEQGISKNLQHTNLSSLQDLASTRQFVKAVVASAFPGHPLGEKEDLFVLGLDSLQTTEIIPLLKAGIMSDGSHHDVTWITAKFVYEHPSILSLSEAIQGHFSSTDCIPPTDGFTVEQRHASMERMVRKYVQAIAGIESRETPTELQSGLRVLLTGSTRSLGMQLLVKLSSSPNVAKISCLDRSTDARERVTQSLSSWAPKPVLDASRISFHRVDYIKPDFGLAASTLADLRTTAGVIIHNAWKVDFNHSLASFEAEHLRGIQNLVNLSASSKLHPRIVFISSISSVGIWHATNLGDGKPNFGTDLGEVIPEKVAPTPAVALPIGYAESKAVAEQILAAAAAKPGGIKASLLRVGQIAGPIGEGSAGKWNEHEWFPLLLKTSKTLGKLPIDVLASIIVDLTLSQDERVLQVYHLVNPSLKAWAELLPVSQARIGNVNGVSMQEWVTELEKVDEDDRDAVAAYPAVKILGFFRDLLKSRYIGARDVVFLLKMPRGVVQGWDSWDLCGRNGLGDGWTTGVFEFRLNMPGFTV
ncbi:NAD(P)-binding protein [Lentithecium fluviatile CBS 122367]|uniref:NAD(P)-binding protein n=1 Tax=Lentithecium fluviatile CBS 122367 TaxID=1168545 RepID=A0A6G1IYS9_9PLEO|nr:NAD(P)-binding protein [Lentithecium fluviatile CBS 122367]